ASPRIDHLARLRGVVGGPVGDWGARRLPLRMTPTFDVVATTPDRVRADLLAVPVFTGGLLGPGADVVDQALGGTLAAFITEAGFEAKRGEALSVPTSGRLGAKAAVLVGMG